MSESDDLLNPSERPLPTQGTVKDPASQMQDPSFLTGVYSRSIKVWSAPLPSPETLETIERLAPGATNRFLDMVEEEGRHRRRLQSHVVRSRLKRAEAGPWIGLSIAIVGMVAGTVIILSDKDLTGLVAMFGPLAGLIALFLGGRSRQRRRDEMYMAHEDAAAEDLYEEAEHDERAQEDDKD